MKTQNATAPLAHTPGPWHVMPDGNVCHDQSETGVYPDEGAPLVRVATVALDHDRPQEHCGKVERAANARLICAAPDLLAALKELLAMETRYTGVGLREFDAARAAIARAEARA